MTQVIMTNVASLNSQRQLNKSQSMLNTSLERLSSGLRINTAKDDAAGLAISQRMTSQINGMNQAVRNANDGVSMSQTAEASLATAGDLLTRIRELAVQSSNASNSSSDRQAIQAEVGQLTSELDRISTSTQFNGQNLLDGSSGSQVFQVGANANQTISTTGTNFRTTAYGDNRLSVDATQAAAASTIVGGDTVISGYLGTGTFTSTAADTAKSIAAGINGQTALSGVTATAATNANLTLTAASSYSFSITSDNATAITVSFATGAGQNSDSYAGAIAAINATSSKTGVTAQYDAKNSSLKLTNATGNNIVLTNSGPTAMDVATYNADGVTKVAAPLTAAAAGGVATINGQVTLDSQGSFKVADASGLGLATNTLNTAATAGGASALQSVSSIDVTTFDKSQLAIAIVDSALAAVNNQRAQYGAMQNRFTSVVANLQSSSENLSASRSRIQDADFAAETASMSKANILQQAGTAMLAQANSAPQNVLSLLK